MKSLFWAFLVISMAWITGCQTDGVVIRQMPLSLNEIRRAIVQVIGEPAGVSPNGYELKSKYYDKDGKEYFDRAAENAAKQRFYTDVEVVGDRRPYDIHVQVIPEIKTEEGFERQESDDVKAEKIADKIRNALHEGRDKRNMIDDFQAF